MLQQEQLVEKERGLSFMGRLFRRVDGCELKLLFDGKPDPDRVAIDDAQTQTREHLHLFGWDEPVKGRVVLTPTGSSYSHSGITVELIGTATLFVEPEKRVVFLHQRRLFEADTVKEPTPFDFAFAGEKAYESYRGLNAVVSYVVKVTVSRPVKNVTQREEVWITRVAADADADADAAATGEDSAKRRTSYFREEVFGPRSVSMEVGVDNLVHIDFRYNKQLFHLNEAVLGKVTFKLAEMDIQYGEVGVVRKEFYGPGKNDYDSETLQKFEIMDGTPIVGEVVPIRLYLNAIPRLTPTYSNVHDVFRVAYFLNLVLVTNEGKRYFKQQEITLYRARGQELPVNMDPLQNI